MSDPVEAFIARWQAAGGSERANDQLFITELCELLGLPKPEPAVAEATDNAYVFERRVNFRHGDGYGSNGYIDCYRRACFILDYEEGANAVHILHCWYQSRQRSADA